jgi:hypothetical protein
LRYRAAMIATLWTFGVTVAVLAMGFSSWREAAARGELLATQRQSVVAYLATGDLAKLEGRPIPYPSATRLARLLDDATLRALLPSDLRPSDASVEGIRSRTILHGAFGEVVERSKELVLLKSPLFLAAGIGLLFAVVLREGIHRDNA